MVSSRGESPNGRYLAHGLNVALYLLNTGLNMARVTLGTMPTDNHPELLAALRAARTKAHKERLDFDAADAMEAVAPFFELAHAEGYLEGAKATAELPARAAYEGYAESTGGKTFDGREMPSWHDLTERIQTAWAEALKAGVKALAKL